MGAIFISYRRSDTAGYAGRLQDRLTARFGAERVFRDIDTLQPGVDFVDAVNTAVASCTALIALIGKHWYKGNVESGGWRIDEMHDYPRMEISAALERGVLIIPVLVEGATMPRAEELPESIQKLARINALELSDSRWDYDVQRLIQRLETVLEEASPEEAVAAAAAAADAAASDEDDAEAVPTGPAAEVAGVEAAGAGTPDVEQAEADARPKPKVEAGAGASGIGGRRRWRWFVVGGIVVLLLVCGGSGAVLAARRPSLNPVAFVAGLFHPSPTPTHQPTPSAEPSPAPTESPFPSSSPSSGSSGGTSSGFTCSNVTQGWIGPGGPYHSTDGSTPDIHFTANRMSPACIDGLEHRQHVIRFYNDDTVNHNITVVGTTINVSAAPHTNVTTPYFSVGAIPVRFYDGYNRSTLMGVLIGQ